MKPHHIKVCDVTLRDGEQCAIVAFSRGDKVKIAAALSAAGVDLVQIGYGLTDWRVCREVREKVGARVELLCRGFLKDWQNEVNRAIDGGADAVNLIYRTGTDQLANMSVSEAEVLDRCAEGVAYARSRGARGIVFTPSFATQAEDAFLRAICSRAVESGANRITLADTLGIAHPERMRLLVANIRAQTNVEIGVHCHDDFGLATACTIAGVEAGATWVDASVAGLGERGGNAALEEVVMALEILYRIRTGLDTKQLTGLAVAVADAASVPIHPIKAVVGPYAFASKLESHVQLAAAAPHLIEPYDPERVGNRRKIVLGKGSGKVAVSMKADQLGLMLLEEELAPLAAAVNLYAEEHKGAVTDDSFLQLVEQFHHTRRA